MGEDLELDIAHDWVQEVKVNSANVSGYKMKEMKGA